MGALLLIAGLGYKGDKMCYDFRGLHYKDLVISYGALAEAAGLSSVLIYVLVVQSIGQIIWIVICVFSLSILIIELCRVRR